MVTAYWEIGEQIYKACGENDRAGYGKKLLQYLSAHLTAEFGKGFDESNLRKMRQFYCAYPTRDTLCPELSWSHYRLLMRIPNEKERTFYAEECAKSAWSVRQLERQIHTMYYQRILASQDKSLVAAEIQTTEPKPEYEKIIKDPYVMEFLQIQPDTHVYEGELEQALIDHLQHFLLELGRGFSFVARQKKFTLDGQNFFIDLVFYNYILKCFVLIDLKMGQLTHQDLGQMQMYVNYYTRELMNEGDTPPIGIVLCADKSDAVVKYTLPEDNHQIFASKYFTYLPTEEELKRELRLDEYYVEHSHEPIITPEEFDKVQTEFERRKRISRQYSGKSIFSSRIICGDCGAFFGSKVWNSTSKYRRVIWQCNNKFKGEHKCETPHLDEQTIKTRFVGAFDAILADKVSALENCRLMQSTLTDCSGLDAEIESLLEEIDVVTELTKRCIAENSQTAQNQEEYAARYNGFVERYEKAKAQLEQLRATKTVREAQAEAIGAFMFEVQELDTITDFDEKLWLTIIDTVTVHTDGRMTFRFQGGKTLTSY